MGELRNSFYETSVTLISNPDKDIIRKEKYRPISLMNVVLVTFPVSETILSLHPKLKKKRLFSSGFVGVLVHNCLDLKQGGLNQFMTGRRQQNKQRLTMAPSIPFI